MSQYHVQDIEQVQWNAVRINPELRTQFITQPLLGLAHYLAHCSHESYHFAPCTEAPVTLWPALHIHYNLHRKIQKYKPKLLYTWAQLSSVTARQGRGNKVRTASEKQNQSVTVVTL